MITYPTDFLESQLRPGELYELVISLGLDITETAFRSIVSELNVKFVSPRVIFSGSLQGKEIKLFYSTSDPGLNQRQVVNSLTNAFSAYGPEIDFGKSEGEIPQAIPLVTPKAQEAPILSLDWLKQGYQEIINSISQKTGLPGYTILPLAGAGLILLIVALKAKPVIILKSP